MPKAMRFFHERHLSKLKFSPPPNGSRVTSTALSAARARENKRQIQRFFCISDVLVFPLGKCRRQWGQKTKVKTKLKSKQVFCIIGFE
jgi:hypothetical protein